MISITIYPVQLFIGFVIGIMAGGMIIGLLSIGEQWEKGFGDGWKCGSEYKETRMKDDE